MTVYYEWDCELVTTDEYNEVVEHDHGDSFKEVYSSSQCTAPDGHRFDLVLVRDDDNGRSWAYLDKNKTLPDYFEDAYQNKVAKVPKRFYNEVSKVIGAK